MHSCAWKYAPNSIRGLLYASYLEWLTGAPLDDTANDAFLALVAKGSHADDASSEIFRAVDETRPLSLSNSDVKIFVSAIRIPCEKAISEWAPGSQRGFLLDRVMLENAVDVETRGFELTCDPNFVMGDSPIRPPNFTPAILLFDYGAAFPSLSQDFLWLCLAAVGFPIFIINAIRQFYVRNRHYWRFGGECRFVFTVLSGVKQRCPLSALLFVIAVDPFLRALQSKIGWGIGEGLCR